MRPATFCFLMLMLLLLCDASLYLYGRSAMERERAQENVLTMHVSALGLTDLAVATEARYTRHPAVSDLVVPFMDHPGALEHFPTGSFWAPPQNRRNSREAPLIQATNGDTAYDQENL